MKALPKKLIPLTLFAITVTSLCSGQPAKGFTVTLERVGSDVVANGSGAINTSELTFFGSGAGIIGGRILANFGIVDIGAQVVSEDIYGTFPGPTSFGSGGLFNANASSGDFVGIHGIGGFLFVPQGYVSGTPLTNSMTFNNATFASLGVTPGTYEWTWGSGLPNEQFILQIGPPGVPDGGSTVSLLSCALLGLAALRRKLKLLKPIS